MKKIGRYEIVEELGRGAMGVVYKASDPTIGRLVALKVLSLEDSAEQGVPGAQEIFMREARAAGRLAHPSIVTIHDAFEDPESKSSCIVMELVPGRTLEKILLSGPALPLEQALEIARQVAEGLDYAHQQYVIHRDLKPANILLTEDARVKITDFGIAKITAREGAMRTAGILGTPSYMSPEQVKGGEVDARSDLFSLGIILYLTLTGKKPFVGDTAAVMFKIVYEDPVLPSKLNPQLSPAHDYLVLRCLAKDRHKRYSSAREFLDDLDDIQHGRLPRSQVKFSMTELRAEEATIRVPTPIVPLAKRVPLPAKRKKEWVIGSAGAALVVLGVVLGVGLWKLHQPRISPPSVPPAETTPRPPTVGQTASLAPTPAPGSNLATGGAKAPPPVPSGEKGTAAPEGKTRGEAKAAAKPRAKPSAVLSPAPVAPAGSVPAAGAATTAAAPPITPKAVVASPTPSEPIPAKSTAGGRAVQLLCRHNLKEAQLTVSSGSQVIFQGKLKGKKKGSFLGIKGGYAGIFSRTISVPAGARELSVQVLTADGATDLSASVPATPPVGSPATLRVEVISDRLTLNWQAPARPAP